MPIFGIPPGGLETWVRVFPPDYPLLSYQRSTSRRGWYVGVKCGCVVRLTGPFATEAEATDIAADIPVPPAPTLLVEMERNEP